MSTLSLLANKYPLTRDLIRHTPEYDISERTKCSRVDAAEYLYEQGEVDEAFACLDSCSMLELRVAIYNDSCIEWLTERYKAGEHELSFFFDVMESQDDEMHNESDDEAVAKYVSGIISLDNESEICNLVDNRYSSEMSFPIVVMYGSKGLFDKWTKDYNESFSEALLWTSKVSVTRARTVIEWFKELHADIDYIRSYAEYLSLLYYNDRWGKSIKKDTVQAIRKILGITVESLLATNVSGIRDAVRMFL